MSAKVSRPRKKSQARLGGLIEKSTTLNASMDDISLITFAEANSAGVLDECDPSLRSSTSSPASSIQIIAQESPPQDQTLCPAILDLLDGGSFYEQCFVERFVGSTTSERLGMSLSRPRSWIFTLPTLLSNTKSPSVRYSIRAASLIYFAATQHNKNAELEAVRWYLAGLKSHRGLIQGCNYTANNSASHTSSPSSQDISVPMMFLYYETMQRTTPDAWAHHIGAAVSIVETRGPEHYRVGQDHAMFRSLRTYAAFKALLRSDPCSFASPDWCEIPFRDCPKISYDFLIDILLAIPHHLKLTLVPGGDFRESIHKIADLSDSDRQALERETLITLLSLQNRWWHLKQEIGFVTQSGVDLTDDALELFTIPPSIPCIFPDTLSAKSVSLYNSMVIIIYSVLMALEECRSSPLEETLPTRRYRAVIEGHSASVLMAAAYQNWRHPYCGDAMRTGFSLKIVSWLGVDELHREEAHRMMVSWGMESKMTAE